MPMSVDDHALRELLAESEDLHADSMRVTNHALDELVDLGHEQRADAAEPLAVQTGRGGLVSGIPKSGMLAGAGLGAAFVALSSTSAFAASSTDVQMLQTAASIENLAIATYGVALTLPFIGGAEAIPVVKAFVEKTKAQHEDHVKAFNAAVKKLGGKQQKKPDPVLLKVVNDAKPGLTGPAEVVKLAIELENTAAETYVANVGAMKDKKSRSVTASIMGVEAQHVAVLLAVQALIAGGATDLIALPPDAARLPAAAGSVGFPNAFYPITDARPAKEGAVK